MQRPMVPRSVVRAAARRPVRAPGRRRRRHWPGCSRPGPSPRCGPRHPGSPPTWTGTRTSIRSTSGSPLPRRRARLEHRAAVVGRDRAQLRQALDAVAAGVAAPGVTAGRAYSGQPAGQRPVLLFPGQGTQWTGMAVDLLATSPAFAAQLAACQRALEPFTGWSLTEVLAD